MYRRTMQLVRVIECGGRKVKHTCPEGMQVYQTLLLHVRGSGSETTQLHAFLKFVTLDWCDFSLLSRPHLSLSWLAYVQYLQMLRYSAAFPKLSCCLSTI